MRILLIEPAWHRAIMREHIQFPPLGLAMVAAVTPPGHEIRLIDENLDEIDFDRPVDLVGITAMTCQVNRAYEIAVEYRRRGVPVVIGGHHASLLPAEAAAHVDAVVIGEAEDIWPALLADVAAGRLRPSYRSGRRVDLSRLPFPRRDLFKRGGYAVLNTVQTTRGCPFDCEFCSVTTFFGRSHRARPVEQVVAEVRAVIGAGTRRRDRFFFFVDDNIVANPKYAKALFRALAPLRIRWASQGTIATFTKDEELLDLAARSGCLSIFIGFESITEEGLKSVGKTFNNGAEYRSNIRKIHRHGIGIIGSFIFGLDHDTPRTFRQTVDFCQRNAIDAANFSILTPYPGTRLAARFETEGRIRVHDWGAYHALTRDVLINHPTLSGPTLLEGTEWAWKRFYSLPSILMRFLRSPRTMGRNLLIVRAYRRRAQALKGRRLVRDAGVPGAGVPPAGEAPRGRRPLAAAS